MRGRCARPELRRGATLVLTAVMLTTILGFVALAVDTMVVAVSRHQLSIAADSGALAGASALADEHRLAPDAKLDILFTAAHDRARQFARRNAVLGQAPVIMNNTNNVATGDVVLGFIANPTDPASPFLTDADRRPNFNSVQLRASRTRERGGLVPAFFSRAIGFEGSSVRIVGTASALNYDIAGYRADVNRNSDLLPIVLDRTTYESMIDPDVATTDQFRFDQVTGQVTSGSDGIKESQLFPVTTGYPGNWGTVNIGVSMNSTSTLGAQIRHGVTSQQLSMYPEGKLTLNQTDSNGDPFVMLEGDPGISAGIKDDLEAIIGKSRTIPIYEPDGSGGNGNNAAYKIVGFAPVRVLAVNFQANPKYVVVQPALTRDPTAIPAGEPKLDWSGGGLIRLHLTR